MTPSRSIAKAAQTEDLNDNRQDKIDKDIREKFESLKTELVRRETELKISRSKTQCVQDDYDAKRILLERLKHEKVLLLAQKTAAAQTKEQDRRMEVFLQTVPKHKIKKFSKSEDYKANTKLLKTQEIRSQSGLRGEEKGLKGTDVSSLPIIVENIEVEVNCKALEKSSAQAGPGGEVPAVSDKAFLSSGTGEVRSSWLPALPPLEKNISCHCHWVTSDSLLVVSTQEQQKVLDMVSQVLELKLRGSLPGHREGWQAGELCIAQVPVTGQWCRGLVTEVNGELAAITLVDYGDVQWCQLQTLRRALYLLEIPTLSLKVSMEGLGALGEDVLEVLRELVEGQVVKLELTSSLSSQPLEAKVFLGEASLVELVAGLVNRQE